MEAHSLFLQAAGSPTEFVHSLAERDWPAGATPRQRALIHFAHKLTSSPETFTPRDTDAIRNVLPDAGEVVEAATVVAGFNFANRVADALDVPLEVPQVFRRYRRLRHAAMSVMSLGIRWRMNFKNRDLPAKHPDEVLREASDATARAGMGRLPSYFESLRVRPHILAGQAAICTSLLNEPGVPRDSVRQIGYLVAILNHDWECAWQFADQLAKSGIARDPIERIAADPDFQSSSLDEEILAFARDITLHAHKTTAQQVDSLKMRGLSERQILNLVLLCASYNAGNRLNRALADKSCKMPSPCGEATFSGSLA